ncbi:MAG TPA: hypothetical protein VFT42_08385 [Solirubrobacteraceae bacterium]|nr:hypothetical protein [Solirubrobacteraceae bacterium]
MVSLLRVPTEDPLWAVDALLPLLDDYDAPVRVVLHLLREQVVAGDLTAIDQGIALVTLPEGSIRLVPLERVQRAVVGVA